MNTEYISLPPRDDENYAWSSESDLYSEPIQEKRSDLPGKETNLQCTIREIHRDTVDGSLFRNQLSPLLKCEVKN
ncbi:hypothetical protein TNCT_398621 [Trichonephila clavata]|uniref:Uncharacterized protein n=1 Tax=Trichonephila clavata TaxID=2740835 RepID=A0A8X6KZ62_TRICU|nr:hypothetical protein TNCT_398621 [Trichonephila clavata]